MSQTTSTPVRHNRLILSASVAGTAVYDLQGERLGHIDDVMIDRPTGRIAYAILSFGGFLGFGDKHHPLPWSALHYDKDKEGYVVDLDRTTLVGAPAYRTGTSPDWDDRGWNQVDDYYGATTFDSELPLSATAAA